MNTDSQIVDIILHQNGSIMSVSVDKTIAAIVEVLRSEDSAKWADKEFDLLSEATRRKQNIDYYLAQKEFYIKVSENSQAIGPSSHATVNVYVQTAPNAEVWLNEAKAWVPIKDLIVPSIEKQAPSAKKPPMTIYEHAMRGIEDMYAQQGMPLPPLTGAQTSGDKSTTTPPKTSAQQPSSKPASARTFVEFREATKKLIIASAIISGVVAFLKLVNSTDPYYILRYNSNEAWLFTVIIALVYCLSSIGVYYRYAWCAVIYIGTLVLDYCVYKDPSIIGVERINASSAYILGPLMLLALSLNTSHGGKKISGWDLLFNKKWNDKSQRVSAPRKTAKAVPTNESRWQSLLKNNWGIGTNIFFGISIIFLLFSLVMFLYNGISKDNFYYETGLSIIIAAIIVVSFVMTIAAFMQKKWSIYVMVALGISLLVADYYIPGLITKSSNTILPLAIGLTCNHGWEILFDKPIVKNKVTAKNVLLKVAVVLFAIFLWMGYLVFCDAIGSSYVGVAIIISYLIMLSAWAFRYVNEQVK